MPFYFRKIISFLQDLRFAFFDKAFIHENLICNVIHYAAIVLVRVRTGNGANFPIMPDFFISCIDLKPEMAIKSIQFLAYVIPFHLTKLPF